MYEHTVYDHIFGDFPAKNAVYIPYIYGSGQHNAMVDLSRTSHTQFVCHCYGSAFANSAI